MIGSKQGYQDSLRSITCCIILSLMSNRLIDCFLFFTLLSSFSFHQFFFILCYADDGDTIARKALGHYYLASAWSRFCHTPKEEVCQRGDAQVF